jgi:hypothetical protein
MWWFFEGFDPIVLRYQLQLSSHDYERKMEGLFFQSGFHWTTMYIYYDSMLLVVVINFADPV